PCPTTPSFPSFSSLLPPPPPPTLFPYTTLFRSTSFLAQCRRTVVEGASQERECRSGGQRSRNIGTRTKPTIHHNGNVVLVFWGQDRKSTRLISSHVSISYAVFCLKKKKK